MKRISPLFYLSLVTLFVSTMVHAKTYPKGIVSSVNTDSIPTKSFGDLASGPSMVTTYNAGRKSFSIEARYKNGTMIYAEKVNNDLTKVKINGTDIDPKEFPKYAPEVNRLEDIHALNDIARSKIYRYDSTKNRLVQMYIDRSFINGKKTDQVTSNPNIVSPEITSRLIEEAKNDSTQNPYKAYIVNTKTNEVTVKELSRTDYLQLLYATRKKAD